LQPKGYFRTLLDVICTKHLPDLEQLLLRRFYEITDIRSNLKKIMRNLTQNLNTEWEEMD